MANNLEQFHYDPQMDGFDTKAFIEHLDTLDLETPHEFVLKNKNGPESKYTLQPLDQRRIVYDVSSNMRTTLYRANRQDAQ